ncbi:hypothetical protein [Lentzea sp. NPDC060358]|uniref:hypothetical protein n=1 Tax=Lentzea sp. NPDC060358 TaxID=3347103 RepID=UPI0036699990
MLEDRLRALELAELRLPPGAATRTSPPPEPPAAPADRYQASDPSRSLRVTVDPDTKVLRFDVSSGWQTRLSAGEFGPALMTAYLDAVRIAATAPRRPHRAEPGPVCSRSRSDSPDLDEWLAQVRQDQAAIGRGLREGRENVAGVSFDVTVLHSPYGLVTLHVRNGALVELVANVAALPRANSGQLHQDLWAVFSAAGLTSDRGTAPASASRHRPRAGEADPEEDLWKGLGAR